MSVADDRAPDPPDAVVVEGDAVELPSEQPADLPEPPVIAPAPPVYEPEAYEARAYAAPAGAATASGSGWPDAGIDLAERPEILVGAAFGGGMLLALILRKLGH